jgi:hypothetical protein
VDIAKYLAIKKFKNPNYFLIFMADTAQIGRSETDTEDLTCGICFEVAQERGILDTCDHYFCKLP